MIHARATVALAAFAALAATAAADPRTDKVPFTDLATLAPGVRLDIRYATENNFTRKQVYTEAKCLLRHPVAERLADAAHVRRDDGHAVREGLRDDHPVGLAARGQDEQAGRGVGTVEVVASARAGEGDSRALSR